MSFDSTGNPQGTTMPLDDISDPNNSSNQPVPGTSAQPEPSPTENKQPSPLGKPNLENQSDRTNPTGEPRQANTEKSVHTSFFEGRGTVIEIREEGKPIQVTRPYGIGIDTHKDFLAVTVIVNSQLEYIRFQQDFPTTSEGILMAKDWALKLIAYYCNPPVDDRDPFHYTIESTATMHYPVLKLWEGAPSVVNPVLAKAGRRKTDRIDSAALASNDITAYWPVSFIPNDDINELRVLVNERECASRLATKFSNRIVNTLNRFGYTIPREGSVTQKAEVRSIVLGLIAEDPQVPEAFHLNPIPPATRAMLREDYALYDQFDKRANEYKEKMVAKAESMSWETSTGFLPGSEMIRLLMSAPQVGEVTAIIWLANVVTPMRFPNAKALAAYCGLDPSVKTSAGKKTSDTKRGGNIALHKTLCASANRLLKNHNEMFGRWGHNMVMKGTSRNRARNAVARKLAVALYYMMLYNRPFSYDGYTLVNEMVLFDIPLEGFVKLEPKFKRYVRILADEGVHTTSGLIHAYMTCSLDGVNGLGRNFYRIVKNLLENQKRYRDAWNAFVTEGSNLEGRK